MSGLSDLERMVALEEICRLKARRDRALDTKDWDTYLALHVPEHVSENEGEEPRHGAKANVDGVARILEGIVTVHHGHTPDITFESPTTARGTRTPCERLRRRIPTCRGLECMSSTRSRSRSSPAGAG